MHQKQQKKNIIYKKAEQAEVKATWFIPSRDSWSKVDPKKKRKQKKVEQFRESGRGTCQEARPRFPGSLHNSYV